MCVPFIVIKPPRTFSFGVDGGFLGPFLDMIEEKDSELEDAASHYLRNRE